MVFALVNSEYPSNSNYGEVGSYVHNMALALYEEGHEVHVFHREGFVPENLPYEINVHYFSRAEPQGLKNKFSRLFSGLSFWERGCSLGLLKKVEEVHEKTKLDVIEIPEYGGLGYTFKGNLPFKVIIGFHMCLKMNHRFSNIQASIEERKFYKHETESVRNGDLFRFPSRALLNESKKYFTIPEEKCKIVPNPINIQTYQRVEKTSDPDKKFHILFTGNLETIRGAGLITSSVCQILAIDERIHITFAGDPSPANQGYRDMIERLLSPSERSRVWFTGPLDDYRLTLMYRKSDMYICPQLFGNTPYSLLEAMASGLPTVAANSGGIPEFIHNEKTGLLFSVKNSTDFVDKVKLLFLSNTLRDKISVNCVEQIEENLNSAVVVEKYIKFCKEDELV